MRILFLILILFFSTAGRATLGEKEISIDQDVSSFKGQSKISAATASNAPYKIHEFAANGNEIKEFVAADGTVFAVSWKGLTRPDLSVLLGTYYSEFDSTQKAQPLPQSFRAPVSTQTSKIVVYQGGHPGAIRGHAYIPDLLPAGVMPRDLK